MYERKNVVKYLFFAVILSVILSGKPSAASEPDIWTYLGTYEDDTLSLVSVPIEHSIVVGNIVYQYCSETDSFSAQYVAEEVGSIMKIESYILGRPVTEVDPFLFEYVSSQIKRFILPETLRKPLNIDEDMMCRIQILVLPYGMTDPGSVTGLPTLKKIILSDTVTTSGNFGYNTALQYVYLPSSLRKIETGAFARCTALTQLRIPEGVTEIGAVAFSGCRKLNLYVPPSVKKIGRGAFGSGKAQRIKRLYCVKNSAAHKFAKKNKIPFTLVAKNASDKKLTSIKVLKKELTVEEGDIAQVETTVKPFYAANSGLVYTSSNPKVIKVDENGQIEALSYGKAIVKVKAAANRKPGAKVTVYVKPQAMEKLKGERTGKKVSLSWEPADGAQGYEVWRSSSKKGKYTRVSAKKAAEYTVKTSKKYYYKVRAYRKYGKKLVCGEFSGIKKI